jgi:hypothetical protein
VGSENGDDDDDDVEPESHRDDVVAENWGREGVDIGCPWSRKAASSPKSASSSYSTSYNPDFPAAVADPMPFLVVFLSPLVSYARSCRANPFVLITDRSLSLVSEEFDCSESLWW